MAIDFPDMPLLSRCLTAIIWCLHILPFVVLIIYVEPEANLHKCDAYFNGWTFLFILSAFILIILALVKRYIGDNSFISKCNEISFFVLWVAVCILSIESNRTGICKNVSFYIISYLVFTFFSPIILFILLGIMLIVT